MLKVRVMGTQKDILWFRSVLRESTEVDVLDASDIFTSKGTDRFYRAYLEVVRKRSEKGGDGIHV